LIHEEARQFIMEDSAMRLPWMATRRWMIAIVVAATLVRAITETERYCRLRSRYAAALRGFEAAMLWLDEGKVDLVKTVLASERLLESELALSSRHNDQVNALSAHLREAVWVQEQARDYLVAYSVAVSVPSEATATAEPALAAASLLLLDSRATALDRGVSKKVEKGHVQWRDHLLRDQ